MQKVFYEIENKSQELVYGFADLIRIRSEIV